MNDYDIFTSMCVKSVCPALTSVDTVQWLLLCGICQFQIDKQQFEDTIRKLNSLYAEAEKLGGRSYLEGCLACLTAYTIFLCMETHYEKVRPRCWTLPFDCQNWCNVWKHCIFSRTGFLVFFCPLLPCKVLKKIANYIQDQNDKIYAPRGLLLTDPIERGLRVVSLHLKNCTSGRLCGAMCSGAVVSLPFDRLSARFQVLP